MTYNSEWYSDPVTQELIKSFFKLRESHLKKLIQAASMSSDPNVQEHGVAIKTIDRLVGEMTKKGKTETEEI